MTDSNAVATSTGVVDIFSGLPRSRLTSLRLIDAANHKSNRHRLFSHYLVLALRIAWFHNEI